jgi:hypothetical protein
MFVDYRHDVCQIQKKFYRCLGLKSQVVMVGIRALGLDPKDQ